MNLRSVAYVRFLIIFIKIVVESEDTVCSHNMNFENLINRLYSSRDVRKVVQFDWSPFEHE